MRLTTRALSFAAGLGCAAALVGAEGCGGRTDLDSFDDAGDGGGGSSGGSGGAGSVCGVDSGPLRPSCARGGAGMTDCGQCNESCCTSLEVSGGTYDRTYTNSGGGPTGQADPATVSTFRLDRYEVTVGRFRQFVNAWDSGSGWLPATGSGKHTHLNGGQGLADSASPGAYETGWVSSDNSNIAPTDTNLHCPPGVVAATWTASAGGNENRPINCVNWYEAYAFCIWDGAFLPSEAEWEYAAAGGSEQREYPWGTTDPGTGNQYAIYAGSDAESLPICYYPSAGACTGPENIAPVGTPTLGGGLWGQLDLAGNVNEVNLDWHASYVSPCTDCGDLTPGPLSPIIDGRVDRGGDWVFVKTAMVPSDRGNEPPLVRSMGLGFRCARPP